MVPVGVALIGAGRWGLTVASALSKLENVDLRWICELEGERLARAAALYPRAAMTERVAEALADASVAAAFVAVDSARHHAVGIRVLESDRHLLVEKPMALSTADAAELRATADARQRVLTVGHLLLHHPAVRRARQLVVEGALGDVLCFESARLAPGPPRAPGSAWWSLAPHDVSLALHLLGAVPVAVSATGGAYGEPGHDGVAFATLHFGDHRVAHIHVGRFAAEKTRRSVVSGTRRALVFDEAARQGCLTLHEPGRAPEEVRTDPVDPLLAQCAHFLSCVRRSDASGGNAAHALAVVRVLEAGARSMRARGTPVELA
jgi:predicted dehydrogenase